MGMLVDGKWRTDWYDTKTTDGRFVRGAARFRDRVTADGSSGYRAEPGRYHLYVSLACPWASRTLIFRKLKRLEDAISLSIVHPLMGDEGWVFSDYPGSTADTANGFHRLYEVYLAARPDFSGRATVPVLWDRERRTIVNNESSEIIRMLNSEFDAFADASRDFYPADLRSEIDAVNERVYDRVNNGVYRAGFATTQEAYEEAWHFVFDELDALEERLSRGRYLCGERITEADWRLFPTLVRFDAVYYSHFKCNRQRLVDFPNLSNYTRDLYQTPGVAETVNLDHIKRHYYWSHVSINPKRIVPLGPAIDFSAPHDRARR